MNKQRKAILLIVIFILQLLIPIGMVSYTAYIEWGLENKAAVYRIYLNAAEWMHPENVYMSFDYENANVDRGMYCEFKEYDNGLVFLQITDKKPDGDYIRSQSGRYFNMPSKVQTYTLQMEISEDDYRWLYFVPEDKKEEWGWRSTENYFKEAYAEVHIFKGHAVTKAVYIDGKTVEEHIAHCISVDLRNDY